jgi:hypothetical protein
MIYYIYAVICTEGHYNGLYYFGKHQTKDLNDGYICSSVKLRNYLKKHKTGYVRIILDYYDTLEELNEAEKTLIKSRINDPRCVNIANGGDGGYTGYWDNIDKNSESYKLRCEKISIAGKQRWSSYTDTERKQICKNMSDNHTPHYSGHPGRIKSEEERRNISERMKGHYVSEETRKKLSDARNNMDPLKKSEMIEKIRQKIIGRKASEETRKKQREKRLGVSSPHKGKIGISKDNIKTYIFEDQLNYYINLGFKRGFK